LAMFFPSGLGVFRKDRINDRIGVEDLSLSQSDMETINEIYGVTETAVDELESFRISLNEYARKIRTGEAHVPGPMLLFFRIAADPLPRMLVPDSFEDWASGLDPSEKEFTVPTLHSEPEWSGKSVRTLERYFLGLRKAEALLSRTNGTWGKRGSRPSDYGRPAYHYRLNPLSRGPTTINDKVAKIDREFLSVAEKYLACLPGYRELLARVLSITIELVSNLDFLFILREVPEFKGLFKEIDVGMIERLGKQVSIIIPAEIVPMSLVRQRLMVDDSLPWEEAKRLRLGIDLG